MTASLPEPIETERLRGRRPTLDDEPAVRALFQDDRMWPTLWGPTGPPSDDEVAAGLARQLAAWERGDPALWIVEDRATGAVVGRGGLQLTDAGGVSEVELAWAIVPGRQGEGLATELARAAAAIGLDRAGLDRDTLIAVTLPTNLASRRVMQKLGMRYERDVVHAQLDHVLYRLRRER